MDLELMDWLFSYTFPEEEKYEDLDYAKKAYQIFVDDLKNSATTRACIFATRHREATELLMELMEESGLVSYVGKVNMDREATEKLNALRGEIKPFETKDYIREYPGEKHHRIKEFTAKFQSYSQVPDNANKLAYVYLPVSESLENFLKLKERGIKKYIPAQITGQTGQTIYKLAKLTYGGNWEALAQKNGITNANISIAGKTLEMLPL